jgi:hypothetical protein
MIGYTRDVVNGVLMVECLGGVLVFDTNGTRES